MPPPTNVLASVAIWALMLGVPAFAQHAPASDEQLRASFDAADVNRDGVIDVDEVAADAILVFGRHDSNRDGFVVLEELPRHSPDRFRRADRDGDGKLSIGEVVADRVYEFFLIDTNRNGVISLDEVRAYADSQRSARK